VGSVRPFAGEHDVTPAAKDRICTDLVAFFMQQPQQLARGYIRVDQAVHVGFDVIRQVLISVQHAVRDLSAIECFEHL
jgi:hypothetical protein